MKLSNLLSHLTEAQRIEIEALDDEIFELQGKCQCQEDTDRLAALYARRVEIIGDERKITHPERIQVETR